MADDSLLMRVRAALQSIDDPQSGRNVIASGAISGLSADAGGAVRFALETGALDEKAALTLLEAAKKAVRAVGGVAEVSAVATRHTAGARPPSGSGPASAHDNPMGLAGKEAPPATEDILPGVKNVIAVASGKGGVGKSTLAANLAVAFAQGGLRTGLMDADIYGPSAPTLFGLSEKPQMRDGLIVPIEAHGVAVMSIGLLVNADQALAWRGPMVMGAVRQLMNDVAWGALDVLVIDTPPGTGDVHLSLAQTKRLTGAVIVSTPQEMALADVRRGVELFRKVTVPILGVIENMAWLDQPGGERLHLFGEGGAQEAARALDAPFLGALPLYPDLRQASDAGAPVTATKEGPAAEAINALARKIMERMAG